MATEPKPTAQAAASEPTPETFRLKEIETQLLVIIQRNHQATFASILSFFATERMGYKVTANTQFKLNDSMTSMEISEIAPNVPTNPATEPTKPETPPTNPKAGVVAGA